MSRRGGGRLRGLGLGLGLAVAACSSEHIGGAGFGAGGAGGTGSGGSTSHFDGGSRSPSLGAVEVVDIAAGAGCAAPGGVLVTLSTSPSLGTTFSRTGPVGTRRFAFGADSNVLMTFAPDGTAPSPLVFGPVAVASSGTALAGVLVGASSVEVAFYDEAAAPVGPPVSVSATPGDALSVGSGAPGTLAVWRSAGAIHGRVVQGGALAGAFDLAAGSGGDGACRTATVADDQGFGVAYNRHQTDGTTRTSWVRIRPDGTIALAKALLTSQQAHTLFDMVRTKTGYLLALGEGDPGSVTVLLSLDEFGNVAPPARRLLGTRLPFGLAVNDTTTCVVAQLEGGGAAMRALDATLAPLAPWVCLDGATEDAGFYSQAGAAAQGTGFGIVARQMDLSASYRVTNLAGTGGP